MKWFALCGLAFALGCDFDVDLGSDTPDASLIVTPITPVGVCPPPARLLSFRITLDPTPVGTPTCWNDGGVPSNHTLPAETFEVLLVQGHTLGIRGMSPQQLGDSPLITVGEGFAGADKSYEWQSVRVGPDGDRGTTARFDFDRLDTSETAGALRLTSSWSCPRFTTCVTPADARSCIIERRFVASMIPPNAAWTTLTTPVLSGAKPFLVVVDLGALSRGACAMNERPATYELTPNARAIEVWQIAWPLVRVPPRTYSLLGAPAVEVESDFGPVHQQHVTVRDGGVDALETRTTTAVLNLPCGNEAGRGLELASRYECDGGGCTSVTPEDRGLCSLAVPFFTLGLDP